MSKLRLTFVLFSLVFVAVMAIYTVIGPGVVPRALQDSMASRPGAETASHTPVTSQNDLLDCGTYTTSSGPVLPQSTELFSVREKGRIAFEDTYDYRAPVWSPEGDSVVFVVNTGAARPVEENSTSGTQEGTNLVAVSKDQLKRYSLDDKSWKILASNAAKPVWSHDGENLYYLAGTDHVKLDPLTGTAVSTGLQPANAGADLSRSRPLPDGRLLAETGPDGPMQVLGGGQPVTLSYPGEGDIHHVIPSPRGDRAFVTYGSIRVNGQQVPNATVLHRQSDEAVPLWQSCRYSVENAVWEPAGEQVAYPMHADPPEIRIYDTTSLETKVVLRLERFNKISGLSWSPDGKYLAYTLGDGRGEPRTLWILSLDGKGQQFLGEGLLPRWSPDGSHIIYATPGLGWRLVAIQAIPSDSTATSGRGETSSANYTDEQLCFTLQLPPDWTSDGVRGAFANFVTQDGQRINITVDRSAPNPSLSDTVDGVREGSMGEFVVDIEDSMVAGQPAKSITFTPEARFQHLVIIILDCGGTAQPLYISTDADRAGLEQFLQLFRVIQ